MNRMETSFFLLNCKHNLIITGLARYNPKSDFRFFFKSVSASGFFSFTLYSMKADLQTHLNRPSIKSVILTRGQGLKSTYKPQGFSGRRSFLVSVA